MSADRLCRDWNMTLVSVETEEKDSLIRNLVIKNGSLHFSLDPPLCNLISVALINRPGR